MTQISLTPAEIKRIAEAAGFALNMGAYAFGDWDSVKNDGECGIQLFYNGADGFPFKDEETGIVKKYRLMLWTEGMDDGYLPVGEEMK